MSGANHALRGLTAIVNPENVKTGMNIKELENQFVQAGVFNKDKPSEGAHERAMRELDQISRDLGINLNLDVKPAPSPSPIRQPSTQRQQEEPVDIRAYSEDDHQSPVDNPDRTYMPPTHGASTHDSPAYGASAYDSPADTDYEPPRKMYDYGEETIKRTQEQNMREHVAEVFPAGSGFSIEPEKEDDKKIKMLSQIDALITECKREKIDISRVPEVSMSSSFKTVSDTLTILRNGLETVRYAGFAEEFLLAGAHIMEDIFDGKNEYFGYKPNLTGWHNQVNVKLKRMRFDTAEIVGGIVANNRISPAMRIAMELIPNAFIYSRKNAESLDQQNLFTGYGTTVAAETAKRV